MGKLALKSSLLRDRSFDNHSWGERLSLCLITLGPSFIKFGQTLATIMLTAFLILGANYKGDIASLNSLDKDSMNVFLNAWKFIYLSSVVFLVISLLPNIFLARSKQI